MNETSEQEDTLQVVCFEVAGGLYALDIMRIKEIIRPVPITRVPLAPPFVEGIIELRGAFLPLVDLRKRLGLDAPEPTRESKYVIVGLEGRIVGLLVDQVADRRRIPRADLRPPPPVALGPRGRFLAGVAKSEGEVIMLLELDEILSAEEKDQLRDMESTGA